MDTLYDVTILTVTVRGVIPHVAELLGVHRGVELLPTEAVVARLQYDGMLELTTIRQQQFTLIKQFNQLYPGLTIIVNYHCEVLSKK